MHGATTCSLLRLSIGVRGLEYIVSSARRHMELLQVLPLVVDDAPELLDDDPVAIQRDGEPLADLLLVDRERPLAVQLSDKLRDVVPMERVPLGRLEAALVQSALKLEDGNDWVLGHFVPYGELQSDAPVRVISSFDGIRRYCGRFS
jgi:hypothetical protein